MLVSILVFLKVMSAFEDLSGHKRSRSSSPGPCFFVGEKLIKKDKIFTILSMKQTNALGLKRGVLTVFAPDSSLDPVNNPTMKTMRAEIQATLLAARAGLPPAARETTTLFVVFADIYPYVAYWKKLCEGSTADQSDVLTNWLPELLLMADVLREIKGAVPELEFMFFSKTLLNSKVTKDLVKKLQHEGILCNEVRKHPCQDIGPVKVAWTSNAFLQFATSSALEKLPSTASTDTFKSLLVRLAEVRVREGGAGFDAVETPGPAKAAFIKLLCLRAASPTRFDDYFTNAGPDVIRVGEIVDSYTAYASLSRLIIEEKFGPHDVDAFLQGKLDGVEVFLIVPSFFAIGVGLNFGEIRRKEGWSTAKTAARSTIIEIMIDKLVTRRNAQRSGATKFSRFHGALLLQCRTSSARAVQFLMNSATGTGTTTGSHSRQAASGALSHASPTVRPMIAEASSEALAFLMRSATGTTFTGRTAAGTFTIEQADLIAACFANPGLRTGDLADLILNNLGYFDDGIEWAEVRTDMSTRISNVRSRTPGLTNPTLVGRPTAGSFKDITASEIMEVARRQNFPRNGRNRAIAMVLAKERRPDWPAKAEDLSNQQLEELVELAQRVKKAKSNAEQKKSGGKR